jgi:hypothetical protein
MSYSTKTNLNQFLNINREYQDNRKSGAIRVILMIHIIINDEPFQYKYIYSEIRYFSFSLPSCRGTLQRTVAKWSPP